MTNPYFVATGAPASSSKARSDIIRAELSAIEAGFDGVSADKADRAGDTFTGAVTFAHSAYAPTIASPGDASTNVATTQFVQNVLGASGALLPPQAGEGGKFLRTNGTSASWYEVPVPHNLYILAGVH